MSETRTVYVKMVGMLRFSLEEAEALEEILEAKFAAVGYEARRSNRDARTGLCKLREARLAAAAEEAHRIHTKEVRAKLGGGGELLDQVETLERPCPFAETAGRLAVKLAGGACRDCGLPKTHMVPGTSGRIVACICGRTLQEIEEGRA